MFYLLLVTFALLGIFALAVLICSRVYDVSLEDAAQKVAVFCRDILFEKPPEPSFYIDAVIANAMFEAVCMHSLLPKEVTLWGVEP
ncbi:MAG: hypothetical protein NC305_07725 [Lachnospiraceae bacterium]|nr:hypothetical protein [Butyrivibrio sp.]MCM1343098.1 hypothetical protein [Muribaculaceae bacterium]MCM1410419.1 hypothetical protein [Lachnospiraceae bacterium]